VDNLDDGNSLRCLMRGAANVAAADRLFYMGVGGRDGCGQHAEHRRDRQDRGEYPKRA
jgi:hypothetical protein